MRSDRPARLLVVTSGYPSEQRPGRVVFIARQVRSLAGRGFPADVLVIGGARSTAAYPRAAAALVARRAWSRNPYGLVHAHGGEAAIAARFYPGVPLLVSYLGSDLLGTDGSGRARGPRAAAVRAAALSAQAVIVKSEAMLAALPRRVARRARVIPTGVDLELFAPRSRAMARAALGWAEEERVALFAADPSLPYKRFELAERACRIAAVEVGPVRLRVAHGIAPNDVPTMMNAADCLLHPSATEGSANVIKEAMACNLPVVATPVGDAPQRLNGVTPSFVCPPDAELLARAVAVCLRSPQRSNGRQHCASVSDEHVSAAVAGVYRELLGLARQPGRS
jgi:glycosyltransferase involved in cell wall biosynthesis